MKLTMWRAVVVLTVYTKFRRKIVYVDFISTKFPDLNFVSYVLYIYPCYVT